MKPNMKCPTCGQGGNDPKTRPTCDGCGVPLPVSSSVPVKVENVKPAPKKGGRPKKK